MTSCGVRPLKALALPVQGELPPGASGAGRAQDRFDRPLAVWPVQPQEWAIRPCSAPACPS